MYSIFKFKPRGFTLVELTLVVAVISLIAMLAVSKITPFVQKSKIIAAENDLRVLVDAFMNLESGYVKDMRGIPGFSLSNMRLSNLFVSTNVYGLVGYDRLEVERLDDTQKLLCAPPEAFLRFDSSSMRGWRGPYIKNISGVFPFATDKRFADDLTFEQRGFFPNLSGLRLPNDFLNRREGCSIYGFPGEGVLIDPWGNPYVLQIPPPQAFANGLTSNTNLSDEVRFNYARVVSAGPNGRLDSPCFSANTTNLWYTSWSERSRRISRQAGLIDGDYSARGDDIVRFLIRNDVDEGENNHK
ncbi:MAG: type II secretion system protein [Kiritimatiellae bacterium]|nr:type II secretion system protein [Kiritimatiellia bacterium]